MRLLRTLPALTAHLVGIPAVVTRHLKALIRNVLGDRCDEIARREYLKVALDLRVHSRAIENLSSLIKSPMLRSNSSRLCIDA